MEISLEDFTSLLLTKNVNENNTYSFQPAPIDDEHGLCICVLDKGFVYVGDLTIDEKYTTIKDAKCIRKWGTTNGLGELALNGPTGNTELDITGTVKMMNAELKHFILTDHGKWE